MRRFVPFVLLMVAGWGQHCLAQAPYGYGPSMAPPGYYQGPPPGYYPAMQQPAYYPPMQQPGYYPPMPQYGYDPSTYAPGYNPGPAAGYNAGPQPGYAPPTSRYGPPQGGTPEPPLLPSPPPSTLPPPQEDRSPPDRPSPGEAEQTPIPSTAPSTTDLANPPSRIGPHVYARAEFLTFWFKNASAPPLATTGPSNTLPTINAPGTTVLFGNTLDSPAQFGGRFTLGGALPWGDPCHPPCCLELSGFFINPSGNNFYAASPGVPIISRPFYNVATGVPVASVEGVANPAGLGIAPVSGSLTITNPSQLYGFELNCIHNLCCDPCGGWRVNLLYGLRQLSLNEGIGITENLALQDGSGERIVVNDSFGTRNLFLGAQVGLCGEKTLGRFFINGTAKVALGDMIEQVNISGSTTDSLPGFPTVTAPGGLLAQSSNIGRYTSNSFCVIPEFQFNVGWQAMSWLRVFVGYDFLFVSQVVRPGNQIDPYVNANLLPSFAGGKVLPPTPSGPVSPVFQWNRTDFWAQGVTAGVQLSW